MKTRKQFLGILAALFIVGGTGNVIAQNNTARPAINNTTYKTGLGLRAGGTSGMTLKYFVGRYDAIEGIFGMWPQGLGVTVLYQHYTPLGVDGLSLYYGGGGHASFFTQRIYTTDMRTRSHDSEGAGFGGDGVVGVEYKIPPVPLAVCFDLKPAFEFTTNGNIYMWIDPGIGVKFTFK